MSPYGPHDILHSCRKAHWWPLELERPVELMLGYICPWSYFNETEHDFNETKIGGNHSGFITVIPINYTVPCREPGMDERA